MTSLDAAAQLQAEIEEAWSAARPDEEPRVVDDVRNAVPPCVLLTPPEVLFDLPCARTHVWTIALLAPGPGTRDTWRVLDDLLEIVASTLDVERAAPASYRLAADQDPYPALLVTYRKGH